MYRGIQIGDDYKGYQRFYDILILPQFFRRVLLLWCHILSLFISVCVMQQMCHDQDRNCPKIMTTALYDKFMDNSDQAISSSVDLLHFCVFQMI